MFKRIISVFLIMSICFTLSGCFSFKAPDCVVTFDLNYQTTEEAPAEKIVKKNQTVQEPLEPVRAGYGFSGWYTKATGGTKWSFASNTVTRDMTLYAHWTPDQAQTFIVKFSLNYGNPADIFDEQELEWGQKPTNPGEPERSEYIFLGWYEESVGGSEWNFQTNQVTDNTTIYAQWEPVAQPQQFTVHFDLNYPQSPQNPQSVEVTEGQSISPPSTEPEREGYTFKGWYTASGQKYSFSLAVTDSFTLYAEWTKKPDINDDKEEKLYQALFDVNNKIKLELNVLDAEWRKLNDDHYLGYKSQTYRRAEYLRVTVDGTEYMIEEVGIRMKGNTSRTDFYNDNGFYNQIHLKLSFSETFDSEVYGADKKDWTGREQERKERKNRTFATLEKLDFKWNKNFDNTYVREIYALDMFRENGLLAQRANVAQYRTTNKGNWVNMGVVTIYEPIDETFILRHFPDEEAGNLYECSWPADYTNTWSIGINDEENNLIYTYDLKTNKKTNDHTLLYNAIDVLNSYSSNYNAIAKCFDLDYFAKFEAVNYLVGNPDCVRNNYNNHYIYFRQSDNKAIFIPKDYDRCLGINKDWNPSGAGMTNNGPFSINAVGSGEGQKNQLYIKVLLSGKNEYTHTYANTMKAILNGKWFSFDHFKTGYFEPAYNNFSANTTPDVHLNNAYDYLGFSLDHGLEEWDWNANWGNIKVEAYLSAKKTRAFNGLSEAGY